MKTFVLEIFRSRCVKHGTFSLTVLIFHVKYWNIHSGAEKNGKINQGYCRSIGHNQYSNIKCPENKETTGVLKKTTNHAKMSGDDRICSCIEKPKNDSQ